MNMKFWYKRSIQGLQEYFREYRKMPDVEAWNKYAQKNNYLNTESIKYISGLKFHIWCKKFKRQFRQRIS